MKGLARAFKKTDFPRRKSLNELKYERSSQEFFRAGEVIWNKYTSINISSATHERKAPLGKIRSFFRLDTLKTAF